MPAKREKSLLHQVGPGIAVYGDAIHLIDTHARFLQAIAHSLGGEPGPVLDAPETFLLCRGNQFSVNNNARRGIAVVGVQSEYKHKDKLLGKVERIKSRG